MESEHRFIGMYTWAMRRILSRATVCEKFIDHLDVFIAHTEDLSLI
ncbi:hypothetical protein ACQKE5_04615 [Paenisporosarcina sp. NPDC076898]